MRKNTQGFTLVEIMIVVVIIGLLAAMAIPAFNKVRQTSQSKAVVNNLRQMASAADQFFIETGDTQAAYTELVGTDLYVKNITPVAGEDYTAIVLTNGFTQITIEVVDQTITFTN